MALVRNNLSLNLMSSKQMVTTEGVLSQPHSYLDQYKPARLPLQECYGSVDTFLSFRTFSYHITTLLKIVSVDLPLLMGQSYLRDHLIRISGSLAAYIYDTMTDIPACQSRSGRRASCRSRSSVSRSGSGASRTQDTLYKVYTLILLLHT